ncbi:MAG TPA: ATP-binding protein [Thermomicrobiales bacterium]|nr:ATP-binding protein [Thermomicrobiales bacterium]
MPGSDGPGVDSLLVESEERYRAVIENASDMIQSVRPDGTFEFVNRAWHEKLGYTAEELDRLIIWDVIHQDSIEHCQIYFPRAIQGETIEDFRLIFKTKDGRPIPAEGSITSRFIDGKVVATHGFFRDITEKLRAQELEERNARLEMERQARYLEKMAALGKLSAGLSHELNNPASAAQRASAQLATGLANRDAAARELLVHQLSAEHWQALESLVDESCRHLSAQRDLDPYEVSQQEEALESWLEAHEVERAWELASVLVRTAVNEESLERFAGVVPGAAVPAAVRWIAESVAVRDQANVIARSTHRISELVSAVKAYSFMDRAAEQEVDVHDGLENTLTILAHRLKDVTIRRDFDRSLPPVHALGSGLNQVWTNIIDNAIDAMGGTGTIAISTRRDGDRAVVEIADDGCGIPPEQLSRIFEPFFTTKPQGQGTGLGLDIAWRIVTEEHGGSIEAESTPGKTVFRVSLPLASVDD